MYERFLLALHSGLMSRGAAQDKLGEMRGEEAAEREARQAAQAAAAAEEEKAKKREAASKAIRTRTSWEDDEIRMLEKGLEKFPQVSPPLPLGSFLPGALGRSQDSPGQWGSMGRFKLVLDESSIDVPVVVSTLQNGYRSDDSTWPEGACRRWEIITEITALISP